MNVLQSEPEIYNTTIDSILADQKKNRGQEIINSVGEWLYSEPGGIGMQIVDDHKCFKAFLLRAFHERTSLQTTEWVLDNLKYWDGNPISKEIRELLHLRYKNFHEKYHSIVTQYLNIGGFKGNNQQIFLSQMRIYCNKTVNKKDFVPVTPKGLSFHSMKREGKSTLLESVAFACKENESSILKKIAENPNTKFDSLPIEKQIKYLSQLLGKSIFILDWKGEIIHTETISHSLKPIFICRENELQLKLKRPIFLLPCQFERGNF